MVKYNIIQYNIIVFHLLSLSPVQMKIKHFYKSHVNLIRKWWELQKKYRRIYLVQQQVLSILICIYIQWKCKYQYQQIQMHECIRILVYDICLYFIIFLYQILCKRLFENIVTYQKTWRNLLYSWILLYLFQRI